MALVPKIIRSGLYCLAIILSIFILGTSTKFVFTQESVSSVYVPLVGITSVPNPLTLPTNGGKVSFNYAVKNFLKEVPLKDVFVVDDSCESIKFVEGDDNHNSQLDFSETWRYTCSTKFSHTTQSIATVTGIANNITAIHKAYATVVVGTSTPPPLVSIVNTTEVTSPLSLPTEGGKIIYNYRVNNPGIVPLSGVTVTDDKCTGMSGKLGDTNGNDLLDTNEVWIYNCTRILWQTTSNTTTVTAYANGQKATDSTTLTIEVNSPDINLPSLPNTGGIITDTKIITWRVLSIVFILLLIVFIFVRKYKTQKKQEKLWIQKLT